MAPHSRSVAIQEVAEHVPADVYEAYVSARDRKRAEAQAAEHTKQMDQLQARLDKALGCQVRPVRSLIIEQVLTAKCPKCRAAFLDFDGCMALTCSRCQCAFCAICLEHCGSDAHGHVAQCRFNTRGEVFASKPEIEDMQKTWRIHKIKEVCTSTYAEYWCRARSSGQVQASKTGHNLRFICSGSELFFLAAYFGHCP
jgi:hypothetical protein